jgi:hypothetical protein
MAAPWDVSFYRNHGGLPARFSIHGAGAVHTTKAYKDLP